MSKHNTETTFSLWATSDAHVVREARGESGNPDAVSRESMRIAVEQADSKKGFNFDIGLQLGDLLDYDYETIEGFKQYLEQLGHSSKDRHCWYHVGGNNDENSVLNDDVSIDNEYYRKYIDPVGEFPSTSGVYNDKRPYPVVGTYERYYFDAGNMRFLFLSDRNDLPAPYGRGEGGFYVDGAITLSTYKWLVNQVITNPDKIIVVCCHHPLKDTTIGTEIDASWKGQYMTKYNPRYKDMPDNRLQPVLHQIYDVDKFDSPKFRNVLSQNTGIIDMWISGHIHHLAEETFNGKGKYACAYGGHHFNVGTICRFRHHVNTISAQSTLFTFTAGSDQFDSKVYIHDHPSIKQGFYEPEDRYLKLKKSFSRKYSPPQIGHPSRNIEDFTVENSSSKGEKRAFTLHWDNINTGVLIVRKPSETPSFCPKDDETYYVGQQVEDGEIAFIGTNGRLRDMNLPPVKNYVYKAFAYNAGNDEIKYFKGSPAILKG
ncbi:MAG: metallophosphoesterase family protein [Candidatus Brocadiia bacterium]